MKYIVKRATSGDTPFTTVGVLMQVVQGIGTNMNVTDIRDRIKILDAVEKPGPYIEMEDAQHEKLAKMVEGFTFAVAHRDLLRIIDDVLTATDAKPTHEPDPAVVEVIKADNAKRGH